MSKTTLKTVPRAVAYYRVSTKKQGASGLGLEAQKAAVESWAAANHVTIVDDKTEVESGKRSENRPALAEAQAACRRLGARLVIAKLDRLARNVAFIANLMEAKVDFVACDMPFATPFTVHIMAAVAEQESKAISARTKEALAAKKARGGLLGSARPGAYVFSQENRTVGLFNSRNVRIANRQSHDRQVRATIFEMRANGATLAAIAATLNAEGAVTRRNRDWNPSQIRRILLRS